MDLAALDLGSNSFHLLVARISATSCLTKLGSHKEVLKLGRVVETAGRLPEREYKTALDAVGKLTSIARAFGVERILVAATSALRDAQNGDDFCADVEKRFGLSVERLSGSEEGRVVYRGACSAFPALSGRVGVVDIGGGSVEVCLGEGSACQYVASLPLGFLKLAAKLAWSHPRVAEHVSALVEAETRELRARLAWRRPDSWIFSGGTARAVGKLVVMGSTGISANAVRRVSNELAISSAERLRELGVDAQRADGIGFGARVFEALLDRLGIDALRISSRGLREGLLLREFSGCASAAVEMGGLALRRTDRNLGG